MKVSYYYTSFVKLYLLTNVSYTGLMSKHVDHFLTALKSVSNTLTYLDVEMDNDSDLWIEDLMSACPNLVTLRLYDPPYIDLDTLPIETCSR